MLKTLAAILALCAGAAYADITSVATLPGGSQGQVQYNAGGGRFGGVPGVTTNTIAALPTHEAEVRASTTAIAASTASLQAQLTAEEQSVAASTAAVALSTTSEAAARLAQDLTIGASTRALQVELDSVGVSTRANGVAISTTGAAVADLYNVKLSTGVGIPPGLVDHSTITAVLNQKLSSVTVNGSMLDPQASASLPLGVDSSSVVVKASGLIRSLEIDASSITKMGNNFNMANGPVKLDGSGKLPILDGSNLTGISGTVTTSASPSNGKSARFTSASDITSGTFTDNGQGVSLPANSSFTVTSQSTFTLLNVAPSTPSANSLYQGMFPVVVANFSSAATPVLNFSVNVTSVTKVGTGQFRLSFARPFSSTNYGCTMGIEWTTDSTIMSGVFGGTAGQGNANLIKNLVGIGLNTFVTGGTNTDPTNVTVACYGVQ